MIFFKFIFNLKKSNIKKKNILKLSVYYLKKKFFCEILNKNK